MYRRTSTCQNGPVSRLCAWGQEDSAEELLTTNSDGRVNQLVPTAGESAIRLDLVARVKQEIAAGTYDTLEKWQAALDRLLERLDW